MGENNKLVYLKRGRAKLVSTRKRKGSVKCFMIYLLIEIYLSIHDIYSKGKSLFLFIFMMVNKFVDIDLLISYLILYTNKEKDMNHIIKDNYHTPTFQVK